MASAYVRVLLCSEASGGSSNCCVEKLSLAVISQTPPAEHGLLSNRHFHSKHIQRDPNWTHQRLQAATNHSTRSPSSALFPLFGEGSRTRLQKKLRGYPQQHAVLFLVLAPPRSPRRTSQNPGGTLVEPIWAETPKLAVPLFEPLYERSDKLRMSARPRLESERPRPGGGPFWRRANTGWCPWSRTWTARPGKTSGTNRNWMTGCACVCVSQAQQ